MSFTPSNTRRGSGFTNLQSILQANRQNRLGSAISGGVSKAGETVRSDIVKAGQQFETEAEKERQKQKGQEEQVNRVLGDLASTTEQDIKDFEGIRGGQYIGPKGLKDSDELRYRAEDIAGLGQATSQVGGRLGLLQRFAGTGPKYTAGQQRLDSLLLGQTGQAGLREARKAASGIQTLERSKTTAAGEIARGLESGVKGLQEGTIKKLGQTSTAFDKEMIAKAEKAQADRAAYIEQAKKDLLETGEADAKVAEALGLEEGTHIYDTDFSKFLAEDETTKATKRNVQSEQDAARINALKKLAGMSLSGDEAMPLDVYGQASDVGVYDKASPFLKNDPEAVKAAIAARKGEIDTVLNPYHFTAANEARLKQTELNTVINPQAENIKRYLNQFLSAAKDPSVRSSPNFQQIKGEWQSWGVPEQTAYDTALKNAAFIESLQGLQGQDVLDALKSKQQLINPMYRNQDPNYKVQNDLLRLSGLDFLPSMLIGHEAKAQGHQERADKANQDLKELQKKFRFDNVFKRKAVV